ncbi:hypothetical protein DEO72_LG9g1032 [Vigna unguiculata]|uniref:Uncharacterized protein n=1 Tax=Vigna unguiculata TaxID=3917 RepID=A0A4D6MX45_VIGUN|nr:hypothetical protein DEO72_LG9g1032 [Vigna unguiculata]
MDNTSGTWWLFLTMAAGRTWANLGWNWNIWRPPWGSTTPDEPLQFKGPMTRTRRKRFEDQIYSRLLML